MDTGFIVFNNRTYPELNKLFSQLDIEIQKTEMSFSISSNQGTMEWSSVSMNTLFAQRKNILNVSMLKGLFNIFKFNTHALKKIHQCPSLTVGDLINKLHLNNWFKEYYLLPLGAAIWSCSYQQILKFPALIFIKFLNNHGLLQFTNQPQWYTLKNKSISYVQKIEDSIQKKVKIIKNADISSITRVNNHINIKYANDGVLSVFDEVIFACHPVDILKILTDVSFIEKNILSKFMQQKNIAYTHGDNKYMPKIKKCWSSWNYLNQNSECSVTYWMNKLQNISENLPVFVTLNPIKVMPIKDNKVYDTYTFYHPVYDANTSSVQEAIHSIQGLNHTWFCGAYLENGFHEDGIRSSIHMLKKLQEK